MEPLFLQHTKSKIVHIAYDSRTGGLYELYCGREISVTKARRRFAFDCPREMFCPACVSRHKRKFGFNPGWEE